MPKQFKKAACFLTVLGLLASFGLVADNSYAASKQQEDSKTSILSNVESADLDKKVNLLRIQDTDDISEMLLDIDWGFDFDDDYEELEEDGFNYVVNDRDEAIITLYDRESDTLVIPGNLGGYPVTMIYYDAFCALNKVESITIPNGVEVIGFGAFVGCENLKTVEIPNSVKTIDALAFAMNENLQSITVPNSVTKLGAGILMLDTSLTNVTLPNTITSIPDSIFTGCESLKNISIPSSVKTIGNSSFAITGFSEFIVPSGVETIGDEAFSSCENLVKITIPKSVTNIGKSILEAGAETVSIYGEKGSTAETYANKNSILFINTIKTDSDEDVIATGKTTANLNVRKGAGTSYSKLGTLSKGAKVEVVKKLSSGWYKIKYNGLYGYVSGQYVKLNTSSQDEDKDEKVIATGVTTDSLNVRKGSSTSYSKLGTLSKGTKVEIVQKLSNGWYKIKYNSSYGYVSGQYVKLDTSSQDDNKDEYKVIATGVVITDNLNVRKGASTSYSKLGTLNKGDKVEVLAKLSNGWYKIKYKTSYGYVSSNYVDLDNTPDEDEPTVVTTGETISALNVRSGPSSSYKQIGYLNKGTKVEIIARYSNGWYKIKYNGSYGYVSGAYVNINGSKGEVIATGKTTAGLNVRSGAGTSYRNIGHLDKGTSIEIVTRLSNGWYKIKYGSGFGYVSGQYVKLS